MLQFTSKGKCIFLLMFVCVFVSLQLEVIHVKSEQFHKTLSQTYALYKKYQTLIHNDPPTTEDDYLTFLQRSPLQVDSQIMFYSKILFNFLLM